MKIAVFVEDAGHLDFVRVLIDRALELERCDAEVLERNASGGRGPALTALSSYLRDIGRAERFAEVLVVIVDGNCHGWQDTIREIEEIATTREYAGTLVCGVPDPHVEVWYLADGRAAGAVAESGRQRALPAKKCEPDYYKALLRDVFRSADMDPPGGGTEFGDEIAAVLDLDVTRRRQPSFDRFFGDLRGAIRQHCH